MAYVEIRKNGRLIARRPVDDRKARTGLRIRLGSAGEVRVAVDQPATLGGWEVRVLEGEPPSAPPVPEVTLSAPGPAPGPAGGLDFSAPQAGRCDRGTEAAPEIEGYRVLELIGRGGMGTVWRAQQLSTHREVALKLLTAPGANPARAQARFAREVELTARLNHPHIGRIYDSGLCQGACYYAMELIDGMPLDRYVRRMALPTREILVLMKAVCEAVHHAHLHGVIHRDLKPSNILVSHGGRPHVLDFGLARGFLGDEEAVTISLEGEVAGTPAYMSPEQALGHQDQIDTRTDVFSLGVILYELLTGRPPHDLSGSVYEVLRRVIEGRIVRPREARPSIDRELEALLLRALATEAANRYASAGELADDIDNYLNREPLRARMPTTFYFLRKRARKYWKQVGVAAAVIAVVLGAVLWAYTWVVGVRAVNRADRERLEGKLELVSQKLQQADWKAVILGRNKKEAEAALNLLLDRYIMADKQIGDLNYQLGQRPTTVPARGIDLRPGSPLGETALVQTPALPGQVVSWTLETAGHRDGVAKLAYSPDGAWVASLGGSGTVRLWDTRSGLLSGVLVDPNGPAADVGWAQEGLRLALVDSPDQARWWAWDPLQRNLTPVPTLSPASDGGVTTGRAWSRSLEAANPSAGEVLSRWNPSLGGDRQALCRAAACLALSEDGRTLAWADSDGAVSFLEVPTGLVRPAGMPCWCGPIGAVAFSPKGDRLATRSGAGTVCVWDAHCWQPLAKFQAATIHAGDPAGAAALCWAPDGSALALARDAADTVDIVEVPSGRVRQTLRGPGAGIVSLGWSSDADTLVAGSADGTLWVWDLGATEPTAGRQFTVGGPGPRLALVPGEPPCAAMPGPDGKVTLWDVREGKLLKTLGGRCGPAVCPAAAPGGRTIASAREQTLYLSDAETGALVRLLGNDPNRVGTGPWTFSAVAWSPDGRWLAAGDSGGGICLWEAEARTVSRSFAAHCGSVTALAWSADGQLLLCGGADGTARAWDVRNGFREYAVLLPLWGTLGAGLALSPEGDYRGPPRIEDHLVYVVRTGQGWETLSPTEFRARHGWVNEPWQVGLYRPGAESMARIYVKADAPGPFDGRTWETAFCDLQDALSAARPDTEIWVAAGLYRPDRGTGARIASFNLKDRVRLLGGFAGTETRVHERDPNRYETILSGDLKGNDGAGPPANDENSYHVVTALSTGPETVLDGLTIFGGNAHDPEESHYITGGGLYSEGGAPTIVNCTFRANAAYQWGGGIYHYSQEMMRLTNCRFLANAVTSEGGGGCAVEHSSSAEVTYCTFRGNRAHCDGAAFYTRGRVHVRECVFADNAAGRGGGGLYNSQEGAATVTDCAFIGNSSGGYGGGLCSVFGMAHLRAVNCRFAANSTLGQGGGLYVGQALGAQVMNCGFFNNSCRLQGGGMVTGGGDITVSNCVFVGNVAEDGGGGLFAWPDQEGKGGPRVVNCTFMANRSPIPNKGAGFGTHVAGSALVNCIFWHNRAPGSLTDSDQIYAGPSGPENQVYGLAVRVDHCVVQGWTGKVVGLGNSDRDPCFLDPNGPDGQIGTPDDNLRLAPGSPCRDAGDNSALAADALDLDGDGDPNEPIPFDIEGRPRVQDGRVDLGAYESDSPNPAGRP